MQLIALFVVVGLAALAFVFYGERDQNTENTTETTQSPSETETNQNDSEGGVVVPTTGATINLSGQGLTKVPESTFSQRSATTLDVSNNNLSGALQAEVRHLQNLQMLDLSNNNFTGVPAEVGQLSNLRVLNLSGNPITGLPYEIGNLKNLEVLDLRDTNYSAQDLEVIKQGLSSGVEIKI